MDKLAVQEYLTQGAVLISQGKYDSALSYYEKAEKENPLDLDVYISKGIALANLDRLDEAKEQFNKALKINKMSGLAYFHLGSIAILQNDVPLGFELYNKAIGCGYDDAQLYYSIGLLHEENSEYDLAIRNYSKAITKDALRPDIRIRKAKLLIERNDMNEALHTLNETILTNPDVFEGYHLKYIVLKQMKQYSKAEEVIDHAIELFPKDVAFVIDKAQLYIEQKRITEAIAILTELEKSPDVDDAVRCRILMEKAQIYATKNDIESTICMLEEAKSINDKNSNFDDEIVFLLANCYLTAKKFDKSLELSRILIDKAENEYYKQTAMYFEPLSLKLLGREEEAKQFYKKAIDEFRRQSLDKPGNLDSYILRVLCLKDTEQYDKALELLDYIIALQPENKESRMIKIAILENQGKTDEAEAESKILDTLNDETE